jgi:hypothetical protein
MNDDKTPDGSNVVPFRGKAPEVTHPSGATPDENVNDLTPTIEPDPPRRTTVTRQRARATIALLSQVQHHGATADELGQYLNIHRGQSSSSLSTLHRKGKAARLTDKRGNAGVYVLPEYVSGRRTVPYGRQSPDAAALDQAIGLLIQAHADADIASTDGWQTQANELIEQHRLRRE